MLSDEHTSQGGAQRSGALIPFQRMDGVAREPRTNPSLAIQQMKPRHVQLLLALTQGLSLSEAAKTLSYSINRATLIFNSPLFQQHYKAVVEAQLEKAANGVYGAQSIFRSHAEAMALIVVNLAKNSRNENVRYASAKDVLDRCGLAPARRQENVNVNELLDAMTSSELDEYIAHGQWPERLASRLSALSTAKSNKPIDITPHARLPRRVE